MIEQPKLEAYEESPVLARRAPPEGTVPRERRFFAPEVRTGLQGGRPDAGYVERNPLPISRELLEKGRRRFEVVCATCHGLVGDGQSIPARNMALRPPPSLHQLSQRPDGYFFSVITQGFGLMPSYAADIPPEERWAVVAYLRALQLSQRAALADAPFEARRKLEQGR
ncbi:MAG: cytochrome c [Myxococcales bacterium]|nr:cytochrome c [Myxococcales bacterium]